MLTCTFLGGFFVFSFSTFCFKKCRKTTYGNLLSSYSKKVKKSHSDKNNNSTEKFFNFITSKVHSFLLRKYSKTETTFLQTISTSNTVASKRFQLHKVEQKQKFEKV
jgi:hypothetical protein